MPLSNDEKRGLLRMGLVDGLELLMELDCDDDGDCCCGGRFDDEDAVGINRLRI